MTSLVLACWKAKIYLTCLAYCRCSAGIEAWKFLRYNQIKLAYFLLQRFSQKVSSSIMFLASENNLEKDFLRFIIWDIKVGSTRLWWIICRIKNAPNFLSCPNEFCLSLSSFLSCSFSLSFLTSSFSVSVPFSLSLLLSHSFSLFVSLFCSHRSFLSIYLSFYLSLNLFVCLSVCLSVFVSLSVSLHICLSVCMYVCLFLCVCPSVC